MAVLDKAQTKEGLEHVERERHKPSLGEMVWHELNLKDLHTAKASAHEEGEQAECSELVLSLSFPHSTQNHLVNNAAFSRQNKPLVMSVGFNNSASNIDDQSQKHRKREESLSP